MKQFLRRGPPKDLGMMVAAASLGLLGSVFGGMSYYGIGNIGGVRGGELPPGAYLAAYLADYLLVFGIICCVIVPIQRQVGGILLITLGIFSFIFLPFLLYTSFLWTLTAATWILGGVLALLGARRGSRSMEENRTQRN